MYKTIDGHLHINCDMSEQDCFQDLFDLGKLDGINIASMPTGIGYDYGSAKDRALSLKRTYPGKVFVFGGLDYSNTAYRTGKVDFAKQAEDLFCAGIDGIKMIEGKPDARKNLGIPLDSPIFDSFYSFMEANARPILLHVGDPKSFWHKEQMADWAIEAGWFWGEGDYPSMTQLYKEAEGILRKFPAIKIIFAHFYFMWDDPVETDAFLNKWKNICFDITPGSPMYTSFAAAPDAWRPIFEKYQDRIIFGLDNNGTYKADKQKRVESCLTRMNTVKKFLETDDPVYGGRGLKLKPEILKKIYYDNFMRVVSTTGAVA